MRQAQGGAAFDNFSKAFGLSLEETQKAVAALVPAFAMGLQRSAATPEAMEALVRMMATGAFRRRLYRPEGRLLATLARHGRGRAHQKMFGSPDYVRQVSDQAAALAGVAGEATGKMLPILASTLMDGMARMGAQMNAAGAGAKPAAQPAPPSNPWEDMFASMMGAPPKPEPEPEPAPPADAQAAAEVAFDAYRKMIDAGREMQDAQIAMMKAMMEGFWGRK